jgi:hypothetical protein
MFNGPDGEWMIGFSTDGSPEKSVANLLKSRIWVQPLLDPCGPARKIDKWRIFGDLRT